MLLGPCSQHDGPEHLHIVVAVVVVQDTDGDEEKLLAKIVGPENLAEGFPYLLYRVVECACTDC